MMFKKDMVAVVKCDGKILREDGDIVLIPFLSEYSILMKNLQSKKAEVKISIDGQDVLDGNVLLINGNSEIELERFIKSIDKGNKFKFIQKTQKIQNHRGDKIDDGIIRIEFKFEKEIVELPTLVRTPFLKDTNPPNWYYNNDTLYCNHTTNIPLIESTFNPSSASSSILRNMSLTNNISEPINLPKTDEGITTMGSESNQKFKYGSIGELEDNSYVITLQLKGFTPSGNIVQQPLTVKTPKVCTICGTNNKNINKYCKECGTFLD